MVKPILKKKISKNPALYPINLLFCIVFSLLLSICVYICHTTAELFNRYIM